jgi:glycosyltransferase involved in cell wall biosynthesis
MRVLVSTEHRYDRTPDGRVWTQTIYDYSFWKRYLVVFGHVLVAARVRDVPDIPINHIPASGEGVSFASVPYCVGPWQYILKIGEIHHTLKRVLKPDDAVILQASSPIASIIISYVRKKKHPYALEVIGDPYDTFSPGAIKHPLRPYLRWSLSWQLKKECNQAMAAAYVTQKALQRRYPCPGYSVGGLVFGELPGGVYALASRPGPISGQPITLIFVGGLNHLYKGPDILISAAGQAVKQGVDANLIIVGDGKYRTDLENEAKECGLEGRAIFLGQVPHSELKALYDRADLFVLPSRQEGLPRALMEAMARALPCIGSSVGGIPEMLSAEDLVPPANAKALADKICEVITLPNRLRQMSARNLEKARDYHEKIIRDRRLLFYQYVRETTSAWINNQ